VIRNQHFPFGPRLTSLRSRSLAFVATWVLFASWEGTANAQPKIPDVKLPEVKVPDVKAPDVKAPDVKAPDVKAPDAKAPDAKAGDAKPADGKPAETKPPAAATDDQSDAEVILFDDPKKPAKRNVVPSTLPKELKGNVKKGSNVGFRDKSEGPVTIEEIVNSPVVTASKRKESASEAPAWVLVVTANDIRERGYTDLDQLLDDLPGMDVIRPEGEYYFRNYMRGYRSIPAEPYLVLLDGVVVNHLFFRHGELMSTFPLTNNDHV